MGRCVGGDRRPAIKYEMFVWQVKHCHDCCHRATPIEKVRAWSSENSFAMLSAERSSDRIQGHCSAACSDKRAKGIATPQCHSLVIVMNLSPLWAVNNGSAFECVNRPLPGP
jgi:hypothetical protein